MRSFFRGSLNPHRLYRDRARGWLAGVCAGIADFLGVEPFLVRLATVPCLIVFFVPTVIAYVFLAIALPPKPPSLYRNAEDEAFWRGLATRPQGMLDALRRRFSDLETRLQRLETAVTAQDFELRRKFRQLDG